MKSKWIKNLLLCILGFCLIFSIFINSCNSQEDDFIISIVDSTYEIIKIDEDHEIVTFNINITLKNTGSAESDNMTIRIKDEDNVNLTKKDTFIPGELKSFIFDDYPLIGLYDHEISIYYYPTGDEVYLEDNENHGEDVLVLKYIQPKNGDNNTPGFGLILFMISLTLLIIIKKR